MLVDALADLLTPLEIPTFGGSIPTTGPDTLFALQEVSGSAPERSHDHGSQVAHARVQVLCRGAREDYHTPRVLAGRAWQILDGIRNTVVGATTVLSVVSEQSPYAMMPPDDFQRHTIAFTVRVDYIPTAE